MNAEINLRVDYVLGFYFSTDRKSVVLIKKNRPVDFNGKINGVGGKIEKDESPYDAMVREFREETGLVVTDWKHYAQLQGDVYNVHVFKSFGNLEPKSITDEIVSRFNVVDVLTNPLYKKTDSFSWLVPMGLDPDIQFSNTFKTK